MPAVFFKAAVRWLAVPPKDAAAWWRALSQAQWSTASGLRQQFLLWESGMALDGHHFIHKVLSAEALVKNLDDLCREHLLTRQVATRLQESVLLHVGADGRWT